MNDVATIESVPVSESAAMLKVIERVAMSPEADITKLEKMLDMQERILDRNAKQAFTADLAEMQQQLPRVIEHGAGHNNAKFAKLEDINDTIRPTLHKFGFAVTFRIGHETGLLSITTVLSHRQGHSEETTIILPADTSGGKNAVQAIGSTISYGKRYGVCAMLNISTGDDNDGGAPAGRAIATISVEQLEELLQALIGKGIDPKAACKTLRINKLDELQAERFEAAMQMVKNSKGKVA